MASFRKRHNSWQYRVYYVDKRTGEEREFVKSGYRTKPEARIAAAEMEMLIKKGYDPFDGNQTLKSYLDWWFETYKEGSVTHGTLKSIRNHINIPIREIGHINLKDLNRPAYQNFLNKIAPDYTKAYLQRMNSTIREAFLDAIEEGVIHKNPAARIKYPTTCKSSKKKKDKFLELEEYAALVQCAVEEWTEEFPNYLYMTYLLAGTGARIGEICALEVSDIDLENNTVNFEKTLVREDGVYRSKPTSKTGETGERKIGLDDFTVSKLREWIHIRNKWVIKLKKRPEFLFITPIGEFIKMPNYAGSLKTLCERNKLPHTTPHMFRHTHETIMWEAGISDLNYIGARLGDKDKTILLETYGHKSNRSEILNTDKINAFMKDWSKQIENIN